MWRRKMSQVVDFKCVIEEKLRREKYSAHVRVFKKQPIRKSLQAGKIDLADVFIEPLADNPKRVHHHFVSYDYDGNGLFIVRDQHNKEIRRAKCSSWDLGTAFGSKLRGILETMM